MATAAAPVKDPHVVAPQQQQSSTGRKWKSGWKYESKNPIEKLWAVGGNFASVEKWIPFVSACEIVEGSREAIEPGTIRKCTLEIEGSAASENTFAYEKLLVLDNEKHVMQYLLLENDLDFKDYIGTFKIEPASGESNETSSCCTVSWSMEVAPIEGKSEEEVVQFAQMQFAKALTGLDAVVSTL